MQKQKKEPAAPMIAFGMRKNAIGWMTVELHIQDGKIVKEIESEPDFRSIALEKYRKLISHYWRE
jgi:hypothetical protein